MSVTFLFETRVSNEHKEYLYCNVTSVCIFIGCWPWCIKGHTHRWRQIHVGSRQQTCFSFFMPRKSFNKLFEFLLYKTNRLHFSACVYCNRSQKTSRRLKNKSKSSGVTVVLYTLWRLLWSITVHMHTRKNVIYWFVEYKQTSCMRSKERLVHL